MKAIPTIRFLDRTTPPHIITLVLLSGLAALTMNIFLPSLARMSEHFGVEYEVMQLSVAVYLGVNALLQIIIGPISDNLGRRPVMLTGTVLFLLATLGCIWATSAAMFLAFRTMQAVIVVGIVLSRAAVRDMVGQREAASKIAYVTMGMAVVPMIGPAVGGALDQLWGWQANFWALFATGVLVLALTYTDMGETKRASGKSLMAQFGEYPELLRSRRFWGYSLANAFASGVFFAYLGGAPFVGSKIFGMTPRELGIFFGTPAAGYFLGNFISGRFSAGVGVDRMVLVGSVINFAAIAISLLVASMGFDNKYTFFGIMVFVGIGNGMTVPNATSGTLSVRPHLAGTASGLGGAIMLGSGAAFSALAGSFLDENGGLVPLLSLMTICGALGLAAAVYVTNCRPKS